ncbi:uncharacterized protein LY89DRAFT_654225 [Mollisia scopiformis]|uniref:Saccharopine dehydrogenase NADP binding domain-containing protein n=1 Tax=Mollisia scopiformis TaxID=149040 RepID=A0A194WUD3_MOLSC|nr:uncharacterized protein LY89DRAFT_654225 [Mollisia scopiformis]KUJ11573.1 hypothetical protein LY89DRAFT_654225 [Mollisia scopiformis]
MPYEHGRHYDLVVFGATGYTGKLTAEHIANHLPTDLRWAIAGRSRDKLEKFSDELRKLNPDRLQPDIEVVALTEEDLNTLAKKTFILITTVGPYGLYGEYAFKACAENGTHYLDSTGEVTFTASMIKKYDAVAKESGSMLFPQLGLESSPADLITWSLAKYNRMEFRAKTRDVVVSVHRLDSVPSGGTVSSLLSIFDVCSLEEVHTAMKPYALSPVPNPNQATAPIFPGTKTIPHLGRVTTFLSGAMDRAIVYRTWGLLSQIHSKQEESYGPDFSFEEYTKTGNWFSGRMVHYGTAMTALLLAKSSSMRKLVKRLVYKPGEGPSMEQAKDDIIEYRALATPDRPTEEVQAYCQATYHGSMYSLTGAFLAQAAATVHDGSLNLGGGIYTPACLGKGFVDRLDNVGFKIETRSVSI